MLRIIIPANVAAFFRIMIPIAMFDVMEAIEDYISALYELMGFKFRNRDVKFESKGMFD